MAHLVFQMNEAKTARDEARAKGDTWLANIMNEAYNSIVAKIAFGDI